MSLTAKKRSKIPKAQFGLPGQRAYPVDTRGRAVAAKAFAKHNLSTGRLTTTQYDGIVSKADKKLRDGR